MHTSPGDLDKPEPQSDPPRSVPPTDAARSACPSAMEVTCPEAGRTEPDETCDSNPTRRQRCEAPRDYPETADTLPKPPTDDPWETRTSQSADGAANEAAKTAGLETTRRIGPYKLVQKLGEGGMGAVFLAEQEQPVRRRVALKIIRAGMDSAHIIGRFEQERQALALMDHPHIAKVLDAGTTAQGRPYFVMELVKGVPITLFCDHKKLTPRERLELFIPVCQAVQHAHQKGVIHRDLKPSNILVGVYDGRPTPKVIDFGVAKAISQKLTAKTLFTEVGQVVGTLEYMAPEQADPNDLDIDTRADIYALGAVLYELLTGSTPFNRHQLRGASFTEMLRIIREVEPPKPSARLSSSEQLPTLAERRHLEPRGLTRLLRGDLDWIVMKCLEKERDRRYETANGLGRDLQRYLAHEPVVAGPPSVGYRLRKFVRRNRGPVVAAAVVLLALLGGIAGTTWGLVEARQQRDAAVMQQGRAEAAEALATERLGETTRQQQRAEEEAAIARAVSDFLQRDLLGQADIAKQPLPEGTAERNRNITVSELLDRAARAIEGKFADQPLTEAALRQTLGDTYQALGRYAEARQHLERSVALASAKLGADHPTTLTAKNNLASLYLQEGKYTEAEPLFREVLAARTAKLSADHADTLTTKGNLALLYQKQGKLNQAEPLYREAVEAQTAKLGLDHPSTLTSKHNLATLYYQRRQYDRAEHLHREVLDVYTAQLGADHPSSLIVKLNLAVTYAAQAKYERAEPLYRDVIAAQTTKLGADHPSTLAGKLNLARMYQAQRKYYQAELLYQEVADAQAGRLGADHPTTLLRKQDLAAMYFHERKDDQAEALLKEIIAGQTAKLGPDHRNTLQSKGNLASLYERQRKDDLAEPLLRDTVEGARKALTLAHRDTQNYLRRLAGCYERQGKLTAAESLLREIVDVVKRQSGADSLPYAGQLVTLGLNLLRQQKGDDAEGVLRLCLAIRQEKEADAWTTYNARVLLGSALVLQQKYADAEPLLVDGYEGMKQREAKIPSGRDLRLIEALERVVQLYDAWGKEEQADAWRKKLADARMVSKTQTTP